MYALTRLKHAFEIINTYLKQDSTPICVYKVKNRINNKEKMKKHLLPIMTAVAAGCMLLSCSSKDIEEPGETKIVNMVADPQPIKLTEAQRVFVGDNNQFTLNFLKTVNAAEW